ncbi:hypothetical protein DSM112329_00438 [Paraconexibacter sp. AEG42_29]|uniref:DUF998 domain-containing protein n=1 Tax=Paraconexibacter sp. AEG42_29 TaxID=2997339 RepID=A0AAU7APL3_9ACTN
MARYWIRTVLGIALVAGSVTVASLGIYDLVQIGTCSDGGPYVNVRPCPGDTALEAMALVLSIFVVPFAGIYLIATRVHGLGKAAPGGTGMAATIGGLWFFLLFTCMGAAALVAGDGPAAPDVPGDNGSGARWVAGTFLLMGAPALLAMCVGLARGARRPGRTGR